jgi:hypothetical protein
MISFEPQLARNRPQQLNRRDPEESGRCVEKPGVLPGGGPRLVLTRMVVLRERSGGPTALLGDVQTCCKGPLGRRGLASSDIEDDGTSSPMTCRPPVFAERTIPSPSKFDGERTCENSLHFLRQLGFEFFRFGRADHRAPVSHAVDGDTRGRARLSCGGKRWCWVQLKRSQRQRATDYL